MTTRGKSSRSRFWAWALGLGVVVAAAAFGLARADWLHPATPVRTATVVRGNIQSFITVSGNLIASDEVSLFSPVSGRVTGVNVKEGSLSKPGQTLLTLDARDLLSRIDERRSALAAARRVAEAARHDWDALEQIYKLGGESHKTVADARLKWQESVRNAEAIGFDVRRQEIELERFTVKAPLAASVTALAATPGAWVNQGDMLMKLSGNATRDIEVKVDSGDAGAVSLGKAVTLSSEAMPGKEWPGKITWIAAATKKDVSSNTLAVRIPLTADAPPLTLGQQVDVRIPTFTASNVLVVPAAAVLTSQGKSSVAVIENGAVHLLTVTLGSAELKLVEVKSGVRAGQVIIVPDGKVLKEHDKVTVAPAAPATT